MMVFFVIIASRFFGRIRKPWMGGTRLGFGLDIKNEPLQVNNTDWVNYNGIYKKYSDLTQQEKAWITIWKNKNKKTYDRLKKNQIRIKITNLIKLNVPYYSKILTLESPEFLFVKELNKYEFFIAEKNYKIYELMKKIKPPNVKFLYFGNISDLSNIENIFDIIYLDFCGTYKTSENTILYLSDKIQKSKCFGFSFCLRKNKKELNDYKFDFIHKIQKILSELNIVSRLIFGEAYKDENHPPMITLFFKNDTARIIKKLGGN